MSSTVSLRITLRYKDLEEFGARYAENISSAGLFLRTRTPKPTGTRVRFELLLADGAKALCGEGVVVSVRHDDKPGMSLRFHSVEPESRVLIDKIVQTHGEGALAPTPLVSPFKRPASGLGTAPAKAPATGAAGWGSAAPAAGDGARAVGGRLAFTPASGGASWAKPASPPAAANPEVGASGDDTAKIPVDEAARQARRRGVAVQRPWATGVPEARAATPITVEIKGGASYAALIARPPSITPPPPALRPPRPAPAASPSVEAEVPSSESTTELQGSVAPTFADPASSARVSTPPPLVAETPPREPPTEELSTAAVPEDVEPSLEQDVVPSAAWDLQAELPVPEVAQPAEVLAPEPTPFAQLEEEASPPPLEPSSLPEVVPEPPALELSSVGEGEALFAPEGTALADEVARRASEPVLDAPAPELEAEALPAPVETVSPRLPWERLGNLVEERPPTTLDVVDPSMDRELEALRAAGGRSSQVEAVLPPQADSAPLWSDLSAPAVADLSPAIELGQEEPARHVSGSIPPLVLPVSEVSGKTEPWQLPDASSLVNHLPAAARSFVDTATVPPPAEAAGDDSKSPTPVEASPLVDSAAETGLASEGFAQLSLETASWAESIASSSSTAPWDPRNGPPSAAPLKSEAELPEDHFNDTLPPPAPAEERPSLQAVAVDADEAIESTALADEVPAPVFAAFPDQGRPPVALPGRRASATGPEEPPAAAPELDLDRPMDDDGGFASVPAGAVEGLVSEPPPPLAAAPEVGPADQVQVPFFAGRDEALAMPTEPPPMAVPVQRVEPLPAPTEPPPRPITRPLGLRRPLTPPKIEPRDTQPAPAQEGGLFARGLDETDAPTDAPELQEAPQAKAQPVPVPAAEVKSPPAVVRERVGSSIAKGRPPSAPPVGPRSTTPPPASPAPRSTQPPPRISESPAGRLVAIDLGGRWTTVAINDAGRAVHISVGGETRVSSLVALQKDGSLIAGADAEVMSRLQPSAAVSVLDVLRSFPGSNTLPPPVTLQEVEGRWGVELAGQRVEVPEILRVFVQPIAAAATAALGVPRPKANVLVPAGLSATALEILRSSARFTGLDLAELLTEPQAAVRALKLETQPVETALLVDVGESHLALTVLRRGRLGFAVISQQVSEEVSGQAIDQLTGALAIDELAHTLGHKLKDSGSLRLALASEMERVRAEIRREQTVELRLRLPELGAEVTVRLSRAKVYHATEQLVAQFSQLAREALKEAAVHPRALGAIILAGTAGSYAPFAQALAALTGKDPFGTIEPAELYVFGLLKGAKAETSGRPTGALQTDIGIGLPGGRFRPLLLSGAPLPAKMSRKHATTRDGQTEIELHLFEGAGDTTAQCTEIGTISLDELPKAHRGRVQVDVDVEVDTDAILRVTLSESVSGRKVTLTASTQQTSANLRHPARIEDSAAPGKAKKPGLIGKWLGRS